MSQPGMEGSRVLKTKVNNIKIDSWRKKNIILEDNLCKF